MRNKYKELFNDTLIFALGRFGSRLILFFLVPLYTNYLTNDQYGTADLVFTISQFIVPIISVVIDDALIRFGLSTRYKKEDVLGTSFSIVFIDIVALFLFTPLLRFYPAVSEWRYYLSINVILTIINSVQLNYLKVCGKNLLYSIACIIQAACVAGLNILFLVFLKMGVDGYLLATIISYLITDIFVFFTGNIFPDIKKARINKALSKKMLIYSAPLVVNNISWWVIQSSDKLMIEQMVNTSALGLYTAASKIPSLIYVFVSIFQQAWGISSIKEIESSNDTTFYSNVFSALYTFVFFISICLIGVAKPFMKIYVGASFFESWTLVPALLGSASFSAISAFFGSLYGALKKTKNNMWTTIASAIVNVVFNYYFILKLGLIGAVIGTFISYIFIALLRMVDVSRYINIRINKKIFSLNCVIIILQTIFVTLNFHIIIITSVFLGLFCFINRSMITQVTKKILNMVYSIRK